MPIPERTEKESPAVQRGSPRTVAPRQSQPVAGGDSSQSRSAAPGAPQCAPSLRPDVAAFVPVSLFRWQWEIPYNAVIMMTGRFELRLAPELLDRIERWRLRQPVAPTKAAA